MVETEEQTSVNELLFLVWYILVLSVEPFAESNVTMLLLLFVRDGVVEDFLWGEVLAGLLRDGNLEELDLLQFPESIVHSLEELFDDLHVLHLPQNVAHLHSAHFIEEFVDISRDRENLALH